MQDCWMLAGCLKRGWRCGYSARAQGAATSITAAVNPELQGQSGAYLSDCRVVAPSKEAQDEALARKLWEVTERQIAEADAARAKA